MRIQITVQVMRTLFLKFISNYQKWSTWAFKTNTLPLWCDLMLKIESYSPLYLSDEETSTVIQSMAEDVLYVHGLTKFFPTDICDGCGVVHKVSNFHSFTYCS